MIKINTIGVHQAYIRRTSIYDTILKNTIYKEIIHFLRKCYKHIYFFNSIFYLNNKKTPTPPPPPRDGQQRGEIRKQKDLSIEKQNELGEFRIEIEAKKGSWLNEYFPSTSRKFAGHKSEPAKMPIPKKESAMARKLLKEDEKVKKGAWLNEYFPSNKGGFSIGTNLEPMPVPKILMQDLWTKKHKKGNEKYFCNFEEL